MDRVRDYVRVYPSVPWKVVLVRVYVRVYPSLPWNGVLVLMQGCVAGGLVVYMH